MLPAISGSAQAQMRREGMDPNREMPIGFHHPQAVASSKAHLAQMEEMKRSVESRFASVATPSNFLQAGLFNTLGNNPFTQMVTAAGGAVGDVWNTLLSEPGKEAKAKDPLSALNRHTEILKGIEDVLDNTYDLLSVMKREGGFGGGGNNGKIGPRSGKHVKQDGELEIKKAEGPKDAADAEKQYQAAKGVREMYQSRRDSLASELEGTTDEGERKKKQSQIARLDKDIASADAKIKKREDALRAAQEAYDRIDVAEGKKKPVSTGETSSEPKPKEGFLNKALNAMGGGFKKANKMLESFSKTMKKASGELSKSFKETSKAAKASGKPLLDAMKGSETAKLLKLGQSTIRTTVPRLAQTAKGAIAKIATAGAATKAIEPRREEPTFDPNQPMSAEGSGGSLVEDVATGSLLAKGASKVAGWLSGAGAAAVGAAKTGMGALRSGGAQALNAAKNAGGFLKNLGPGAIAKTAGLAHLATSGIEAAYDSFNTDTTDYAKRMDATAGDSMFKDMGVRAVGTLQDLGNKVTFGAADRVGNWLAGNGFERSDYYKKNVEKTDPKNEGDEILSKHIENRSFQFNPDGTPMVPAQVQKVGGASSEMLERYRDMANQSRSKVKAKGLETASRAEAIREMKTEIDTKQSVKTEPVQAVNVNNVNQNNTTILPSRHDVRNTDMSFNRYLDRSLG